VRSTSRAIVNTDHFNVRWNLKTLLLVADCVMGLVALFAFTRALIASFPPNPDIETRDKYIKTFAICALCLLVIAAVGVAVQIPTPFYPKP
jgi:hypothetical protein